MDFKYISKRLATG